ncbi:hypothetical protein F503_00347 [Ophiostoma piceae UAMH 11346]|uniref:Uncharacterized protein n=1 Tax=Ophiostoma piceae (strain UAMH 11346) TaxID=1262450 RepID=S3D2V6_OPHP1|nr:hypothetical protein F503_00347 [Ophiostoma piceae UAMH 11346]
MRRQCLSLSLEAKNSEHDVSCDAQATRGLTRGGALALAIAVSINQSATPHISITDDATGSQLRDDYHHRITSIESQPYPRLTSPPYCSYLDEGLDVSLCSI